MHIAPPRPVTRISIKARSSKCLITRKYLPQTLHTTSKISLIQLKRDVVSTVSRERTRTLQGSCQPTGGRASGTSSNYYGIELIAIPFILKAHGRKINPFPCYKGRDLILLAPPTTPPHTYICIYIYISSKSLSHSHSVIHISKALGRQAASKLPVYVTPQTPVLIETVNHYVITLRTLN